MKIVALSPCQMPQLAGELSHTPKGCGFDSWLGHIPRLWVWSPVREHIGGKGATNRSMFLILSFSLSLHPSSLLTYLWVRIKKKRKKHRRKIVALKLKSAMLLALDPGFGQGSNDLWWAFHRISVDEMPYKMTY